MKPILKVAFYPMGRESWVFGIVFLKNLMHCLNYYYKDKIKCYLIIHQENKDAIPDEFRSIKSDNILTIPYIRKSNPLWISDYIARHVFAWNLRESISLKINSVDAIFGCALCCKYNRVPALSWIWDFQHAYLPEMFSPKERLYRDRLFSKTAKLSSRIIVMSDNVKNDFNKFLPQFIDKVRVVRPIVYIPESTYTTNPHSIIDLYNLPMKFIYLPNQFWKHKNHETAFKCIKLLKEKNIPVTLVCSGYPYDYRHPTHFYDLFQKLSKWNIRDQVIYIGKVSSEQNLLLMRQSICVLNPSIFEGFGMTINEARSLGKQVLLSDMPAHREQNPPKAIYFNPLKVEGLAEKMAKIWQETLPGPDTELEEKARRELPDRIKESAQSFMNVVKEVT